MSLFDGIWQEYGEKENFEQFSKDVGLKGKDKDDLRSAMETMEYVFSREEDRMYVTETSSGIPGKVNKYSFLRGREFDHVSIDGYPYRATITIDLEKNIMFEKGKNKEWGEYELERKVDGETMTCTFTSVLPMFLGRPSIKYRLKKVYGRPLYSQENIY